MAKYVMVTQSRPTDGREDDYNHWFDNTHLPDICAIPGVLSGRRFKATPIAIGQPGMSYLSIFELETDNPGAVLAEIGKRTAAGQMVGSDAIDSPATILWIYQQRDA